VKKLTSVLYFAVSYGQMLRLFYPPLRPVLAFATLFAGHAFGQQSRCAEQTGSFVKAKLAYWQPRLELQAWTISVVMAHAGDLKPETLGNIHWDARHKTAVIRVLDPSDYRLSCAGTMKDMEVTLVHEMVHLELSSLPRSQASRAEEERAVNRITDALLGLERQMDDLAPTTASR
jgi:hypothetical protein